MEARQNDVGAAHPLQRRFLVRGSTSVVHGVEGHDLEPGGEALQLVLPLPDQRRRQGDDGRAREAGAVSARLRVGEDQRDADHRLAHSDLVAEPAAAPLAHCGAGSTARCRRARLLQQAHKARVGRPLQLQHEREALLLVRFERHARDQAPRRRRLDRKDLRERADEPLAGPARGRGCGRGRMRGHRRGAAAAARAAAARGCRCRVVRGGAGCRQAQPLCGAALAQRLPVRYVIRGVAVAGPLPALGHEQVAHVAKALRAVLLWCIGPLERSAVVARVREVAQRNDTGATGALHLVVCRRGARFRRYRLSQCRRRRLLDDAAFIVVVVR